MFSIVFFLFSPSVARFRFTYISSSILGPLSDHCRTNHVSFLTLYILCIYPVIFTLSSFQSFILILFYLFLFGLSLFLFLSSKGTSLLFPSLYWGWIFISVYCFWMIPHFWNFWVFFNIDGNGIFDDGIYFEWTIWEFTIK